jgi:poly [ADP-ribose] polymerase
LAGIKAWKHGDPQAPRFPDEFEILHKAVLQVTDIKTNRNKYYAIELHAAQHNGRQHWRVFTHYGRTDDLETNPAAGQRECRYFDHLGQAQAAYQSIYREKTGPAKGYKEVSLASSRIGSQKAQGTSSGEVDSKTLERIAKKDRAAPPAAAPTAKIDPAVAELVRYLYAEATQALTSTVAAKITAHGIETPLGILTIGQIEKGEGILEELYEVLKDPRARRREPELERLSGELYTVIPHRIGRSREAVQSAVITTLEAFQQKQETLQLMKDMLQVNGEAGSVLYDAKAETEYAALRCEIKPIPRGSEKYRDLERLVLDSQVKTRNLKVHSLYSLRRAGEWEAFDASVGNERLLFHGSRIQNWVGILSRGILMPKIVVSLGVSRTDPGWLGNGLYFGDAACTSYFYTTPGRKKTRFMGIARVALGRIAEFRKITYGLPGPPAGHDSCHGVRGTLLRRSEFADDEYVVYKPNQQRLEYLVEMS